MNRNDIVNKLVNACIKCYDLLLVTFNETEIEIRINRDKVVVLDHAIIIRQEKFDEYIPLSLIAEIKRL